MEQRLGKFITFEGIDGSGKTTQMQHASSYLRQQGFVVHELREPGGTALGENIRNILLKRQDIEILPVSELLLFAAARYQICHEVIKPWLAQGDIILCDRFFDSTVAYQGYGREIDLNVVDQLVNIATAGIEPDLTLWFDLPCLVANARMDERDDNNRIDAEGLSFMQRISEGYAKQWHQFPERIKRIDASPAETTVADSVCEIIGRILK